MADIKEIVYNLSKDVEKLDRKDPEARFALLAGARSLVAQLETANEFVVRTTWAEPVRNICLNMALSNGLLSNLAASKQPMNSSELAKASNMEEELTRRIMRHLGAMDVVDPVKEDTFAATKLSSTLIQPGHLGGMVVGTEILAPVMQAYPGHVAALGNKSPTELSDAAFSKGLNTKHDFYGFLFANPEYTRHFMMFMTGYREGTAKWFNQGFYPVVERLGDSSLSNDDSVLIIDIGGGIGTDIMEFCQQQGSSLPGRIILQDRPHVLEAAKASGKLDPRIECMETDFFTPQPVKGARAYHMHSILHNWPDQQSLVILKNIASAMKKGYSKLLIFENVIPQIGARWSQTSEDFVMSMIFSAGERTAVQWTALLKSAGIKITGIWTVPAGEESVIEAELE